jgi:lysophospholipase L1-like esterase
MLFILYLKNKLSSFWISLIIAVVCLFSLEMALRALTSKNSKWQLRLGDTVEFDPHVHFRHKRNFDMGQGISTNEYGYLAPAHIQKELPQDRLRIIYLGDSNTVTPRFGNYPVFVEKIVSEALGMPVETVNAAIPGYSSLNARKLFEKELSEFEAHHIVIYLGWNDLGQYGPEGLPYKLHEQGYQTSVIQKILSNIYSIRLIFALKNMITQRSSTENTLLNEEENRIYTEYQPVHFYENMDTIIKLALKKYPNVHIMNLATLTSENPTEQEMKRMHFPVGMSKNVNKLHTLVKTYSEAVDKVAKGNNLEVIDLFSLFNTPENRETFTDSCHMNEDGARIIASVVSSAIIRSENHKAIP